MSYLSEKLTPEEEKAHASWAARQEAPVTEEVGRKLDDEKVRIELVPSEFIFATAAVLTYGANKYSDRNWENGIAWGRVFGALMRHMWAWWAGRGPAQRSFLFGNVDDETEHSHLWHAACCLAFLISYEERLDMHRFDDRTKR